MTIRPVGTEWFPADRQTDGRTDRQTDAGTDRQNDRHDNVNNRFS